MSLLPGNSNHAVNRLLRVLAALCIFGGMSPAETQQGKAKETPAAKADLTAAKQWILSQLGDQAVAEKAGMTLVFGDNDELSGSGGVNRYGAKYESNADGRIGIKNLFATQRAALDKKRMKREADYFRLLETAGRAFLSEGNLVLECKDEGDKLVRLVFIDLRNG